MHSPTETPAMPASASGVSKTRSDPNSSWRPSVTRNTPPSLATSSPNSSIRSSSASESRSAWFSAFTIVTSGTAVLSPGEPEGRVALPLQVLGKVALEDPLEELLRRPRLGGDHAIPHPAAELLRRRLHVVEE